jgi:ribosome maturation factor RimP|tara:strand:- start:959 stop:1438 length:480 start_codon:yes stop_codon:yes gene_type:complete
VEERIEQLLLEKFQDVEYQDFFLVEINFNPANKKLDVFIDSDTILTIGQCAKLNRYLQNHIDENDWLGETYTLDVSSPGITKPLIFKRQYVKNIGRNVKVSFVEQGKEEGELVSVDDEGIVLEKEITIKKDGKKKKHKEMVQTPIMWEKIHKTVVKIKF